MKLFALIFLIITSACTKHDLTSPEAALTDFVDSRVGKVIGREFFEQRVSGKLLQNFENMSQANFEQFANMKNIKSDSFKILSKECQDTKCFITYSISYQTLSENKSQFASEVKKVAELVQVKNKWLIADVSNIKTYIESLEPINAYE